MNLEKLQDVLYDVLCVVDDIAQKEQIPYMLTGGSALGAVRHQNIIPWDDDIDIVIWQEDLPAMLAALQKNLPPYMKVTVPEDFLPHFYDFVIRVQDTRYHFHVPTKVDEVYNNNQNYVGVDIFLVGSCGNSELEFKWFNLRRKFIYALARGHRVVDAEKSQGVVTDFALKVCGFVGRLIPMKTLLRWQYVLYTSCQKPASNCCELNTIPPYFRICSKSEWYRSQTYMQFRDRMIPVMSGWDAFLTNLYGDYMKPPKDKSIYIQHFDEATAEKET